MAARRIRERRAHRRAMAVRLQRAQRDLTRDPADTRPGTDNQALADCWNAWNATPTRKEKP